MLLKFCLNLSSLRQKQATAGSHLECKIPGDLGAVLYPPSRTAWLRAKCTERKVEEAAA